ncbi:MAG: MBL fold metallo-hydrolase [Paracoccaceae bacterium]
MSIFLTILGTRGSLPNTAAACASFGGATSCYHMDIGNSHLIFDAGSGIVELGAHLVQTNQSKVIDLFITHFHYDHIMGLPFFAPLFEEDWQIRIWSSSLFGPKALDEALDRLFSAPLCPITRDDLKADISLNVIDQYGEMELQNNVWLATIPLLHPGGNAAFRITRNNHSIVYSGDFEHGDRSLDDAFIEFMSDADYALLDCTYSPQSYRDAKGYGHAHWKAAGELAKQANVREWIGVHHKHLLDDITLLQVEAQIQREYPNGKLAREGMTFTI